MFRILGRKGLQLTQYTNPRKLGESIPGFESMLVLDKHLLHENVERVLFCDRFLNRERGFVME